jgi:hypothetical protein
VAWTRTSRQGALQSPARCDLGRNGREVLAPANRQKADRFAAELAPLINEIKEEGVKTVRAIAAELNRRAVPTARPGALWHRSNTRAFEAYRAAKSRSANTQLSW